LKIAGPVCPVDKEGQHKLRPWHDKIAETSGFVCVKCAKIWIWQGKELLSWWDEYKKAP
jgi:hypothetical protein